MNFEELYEMYAQDIYRFAYWLSRDRDEAKDITSETFIKAWMNFGRIRTKTMKGFLLTIARNLYIDQNRKRQRQIGLENLSDEMASRPDKDAEIKSELERVNGILQGIPEMDRTALLLRVQHELDYEEIARILEISISLATVKVHRVRKKIIEQCVN